MGRKKKKQIKPWCWYCNREFDDENILINHQKSKHFKCEICHKKLFTGPGLVIHCMQVHKEKVDKIPNALPNRIGVDIEVYGMEGIPPEELKRHECEKLGKEYNDDQPEGKKAKLQPPHLGFLPPAPILNIPPPGMFPPAGILAPIPGVFPPLPPGMMPPFGTAPGAMLSPHMGLPPGTSGSIPAMPGFGSSAAIPPFGHSGPLLHPAPPPPPPRAPHMPLLSLSSAEPLPPPPPPGTVVSLHSPSGSCMPGHSLTPITTTHEVSCSGPPVLPMVPPPPVAFPAYVNSSNAEADLPATTNKGNGSNGGITTIADTFGMRSRIVKSLVMGSNGAKSGHMYPDGDLSLEQRRANLPKYRHFLHQNYQSNNSSATSFSVDHKTTTPIGQSSVPYTIAAPRMYY